METWSRDSNLFGNTRAECAREENQSSPDSVLTTGGAIRAAPSPVWDGDGEAGDMTFLFDF